MSAEFDTLTAKVEQTLTVEESAIALISGLAKQLAANANDPAAILALANKLDAETQLLSAAIVANTQSTTTTVPGPTGTTVAGPSA